MGQMGFTHRPRQWKKLEIIAEDQQNFDLLNKETLLEIEEVDPHDNYFFSESEQFRRGAQEFHKEADFDGAFSKYVNEIPGRLILNTIDNIQHNINENFKEIQKLIIQHNQKRYERQDKLYKDGFKAFVNDQINVLVGVSSYMNLQQNNQLAKVYQVIMIKFLTQTKDEVQFLLNELRILNSYFHDVDESAHLLFQNKKLFLTPPTDINNEVDKAFCFKIFTRIVFKIAAALERVTLFTKDRVSARSYNLEVFEAESCDAYQINEEVNVFDRCEQDHVNFLLEQRDVNEETKYPSDPNFMEYSSRTYPAVQFDPTLALSDCHDGRKKNNNLLRIYSLAQLLNQEITRLNQVNIKKKTLATEIIDVVEKLLGQEVQCHDFKYKLANSNTQFGMRDLGIMQVLQDQTYYNLKTTERLKFLSMLWLDFTETTSFKSKANSCEGNNFKKRFVSILLQLQITNQPCQSNWIVQLEMFKDQNKPLSIKKKFEVKTDPYICQDLEARNLFLNVPFDELCSGKVVVLVKVFEKRLNNELDLSHLIAEGIFNVSRLFWGGLKCGVQSGQEEIYLEPPFKEHLLESTYRSKLKIRKRIQRQPRLKQWFQIQARAVIFSNLIDNADVLDLDSIGLIPQLGFQTQIQTNNKMRESFLYTPNYNPELPNRPFTFEQRQKLHKRAKNLATNVNAVLIKVNTFKAETQDRDTKLIRFVATIENKYKDILHAQQDYPILFNQLDSQDEPIEKYCSPIFRVKNRQANIFDSFMVSLPESITVLKDFQLHIDIQSIGWRDNQPPPQRLPNLPIINNHQIRMTSVIENPGNCEIQPRYRKTIDLIQYNKDNIPTQKYDRTQQQFRPCEDSDVDFEICITPHTNFNLFHEDLIRILQQHKLWRKDLNVDYSVVEQSVFATNDIKTIAQEIIVTLFQMFVRMQPDKDGYNQVLTSILELLRKLNNLPQNQGHHILQMFIKQTATRDIVNQLHGSLQTALVYVSEFIRDCAKEKQIIDGVSPSTFAKLHLRAMLLLPIILNLAKDCYLIHLQELTDEHRQPSHNEANTRPRSAMFKERFQQTPARGVSLYLKSTVIKQASDVEVQYSQVHEKITPFSLEQMFIRKSKLILANLNQAFSAKFDHSLFILLRIYLEHMPQLFDFAATTLPEDLLIGFLRPLWQTKKEKKLPADRIQDWIHPVIQSAYNIEYSLRNDEDGPNLFIQKTIAASQILQSPQLVALRSNPNMGLKIVTKICRFFSSMMEDVRVRGERSFARQREHENDENISKSIFNHAVLFFLQGFILFQNNFSQFNPRSSAMNPTLQSQAPEEEKDEVRKTLINEQDLNEQVIELFEAGEENDQIEEEVKRGRRAQMSFLDMEDRSQTEVAYCADNTARSETMIQRYEDDIDNAFFVEDDLEKIDSHGYIIQDSDLFVQILLEIKSQELKNKQGVPPDLPQAITYDKASLIEKNVVVVFHLLDSLKRHNIRRLLERGKNKAGHARSTRKSATDLLSQICSVLKQETFQFQHPFKSYGEQFGTTIIWNFSMQLGFNLIQRLKLNNDQILNMRALFSQLWIIMLLNFIRVRKSNISNTINGESKEVYFKMAGKYLKSALDFMIEVGQYSLMVLVPNDECVSVWLKQNILPELLEIIQTEATFETFNTVKLVIRFLLLYSNMIKEEKASKQINVLAYLVDIEERVLNQSVNFQSLIDQNYNNDNFREDGVMEDLMEQKDENTKQLQDHIVLHTLQKTEQLIEELCFNYSRSSMVVSQLSHQRENFGGLVKDFKNIDNRIMVYEASTEAYCQQKGKTFDLLYNVYCHYQLLKIKLDYKIETNSMKLNRLFENYLESLTKLQKHVMPTQEKIEELGQSSYEIFLKWNLHLTAEIAFCYKENVQEAEKLLQMPGDALKAKQERNQHIEAMLRLIKEAEKRLQEAKFYFQAIELKKLYHQYTLTKRLTSITEKSAQQFQTLDKSELGAQQGIIFDQSTTIPACSYWHIKFVGRDFAAELRNSRNGFLMRAKDNQELPFLMEEFKQNYPTIKEKIDFKSVKSMKEVDSMDKMMARPTIALIPDLDPLTDNIKRQFNRGANKDKLASKLVKIEESKGYQQSGFKEFFRHNFKKNFVIKSNKINTNLQKHCQKVIHDKITDFANNQTEMNKFDIFHIFEYLEEMEGLTGQSFIETFEKFYKKCLQREGIEKVDEDNGISVDTVKQIAFEKWESIIHFRDTVLAVYEVREDFPTIFFMQEITEIFEVSINCVRQNYYRIKQCIEEHKEVAQILEDCLVDSSRLNQPTKVPDALNKVYSKCCDELMTTVKGGISTPLGLFFPPNQEGYERFNESNPNYHELLKFIKSVEKFLDVIMYNLRLLERKQGLLYPDVIEPQSLVATTLDKFFESHASYQQKVEEIRERLDIDYLVVQELDRLQSSDSDW